MARSSNRLYRTPTSKNAAARLLRVSLLVLLAAGGCARKPNVLLISVDSLRADHLGAYGYQRDTSPTFDQLAREGSLFTSAMSSTSWTLPAHVALLTGLPDSMHAVTGPTSSLSPRVTTLAQVFKAAGYYTVGLYSGPFLHPAFGFGRGFDEYVDCTSYQMKEDDFVPNLTSAFFRSDS